MASLNNYLDELRGSQPLGHVDALDLKKVTVKRKLFTISKKEISSKEVII